MKKFVAFAWIFLVVLIDDSRCVDVHFENKDGGFFLKHSPRQHFQPSPEISVPPGSLLSVDRFTVFQTSQPISVRATYGPFSTKQTVPARYVVPDPLPLNASVAPTDLQDLATHHLDMSAHIVRNEIPRDSPVLRVLFHTGTDPGGRRQILFSRHHQKICIVLHATLGNRPALATACSPDGEDGVCLAQITIPSSWWPPLPPPDKDGRPGKATKTPPRLVQVAYSVLEPRPDDGENCQPRIQFQPSTILGMIPLVPAKAAYKELKLAEGLTMLVPHPPLFPLSRMHIPVFIEREKAKLLTAVVVRGRVKSGIRILNATPSEASTWNISMEINPRHTGASVTALRKEPVDSEPEASSAGEVVELFTWLIEVSEDAAELYEGARVVWSMKLEPHQEEGDGSESHRTEGRKSTTRLDVQKDDIQAVVPISKNWEVLNTAVLTGRQVSQAMKVLIVSQAAKAADVTFQASCHSEDDSVLKVSSSCSSVYVDGSEARGSVNGSVLVKYGTYTGLARFTVWMPEFPLDLQVLDTRLSQIKSWKVPDYHASVTKIKRRRKRSYSSWSASSMIPDDMGNVIERPTCRLRYQQSPVDVYAHFMASDHDSGRVTYLVNRRTWLRVTDLVLPLLRVSDPRIASLRGRILQGRSMGRTEVQVLSPITGRVIGAKEVRVGNDKVGISRLSVQVVSGLQLNISPDSVTENGYVAETSVTRKLTAQYQEGLLDIELEFSDGSRTPLREVPDVDYHLVVESLDPEVVAFAPMVASHHPRVIAVGEGSGDLLQVTVLLPEECRSSTRPKLKGTGPLASAAASVTVDFSASDLPHRPDILQNDGGSYSSSKGGRDFQDLQDILKGSSMRDEDNDEPNVQARQHQGGKGISRHHAPMNMTPLEISMYVLLAAFCFAIVVFVVSCMVYASKFKPIEAGTHGMTAAPVATSQKERKPRETTTNAHDWVWLGRATLENTSNRSSTVNNNPPEMRITTNPLNMNYCEPEDCVPSSFSNPCHIELPSNTAVENANCQVDSTTYCKSKPGGGIVNSNTTNDEVDVWNKPTPPPPLPPHAPPPVPPERHKSQELIVSKDYRPPVPPHRNIGVTARSMSVESSPPRKHHHHHHRSSRHQQDNKHAQDVNKQQENQYLQDSNKYLKENGKHQPQDSNSQFEYSDQQDCTEEKPTRTVFEFDDESPVDAAPVENLVKIRHKNVIKNDNEDDVQFVHLPNSENANGNGNRSPEVKRATIVGNPMFSAEDNLERDDVPAELSGLDELGMDYEQIMHYFDNLKESNA